MKRCRTSHQIPMQLVPRARDALEGKRAHRGLQERLQRPLPGGQNIGVWRVHTGLESHLGADRSDSTDRHAKDGAGGGGLAQGLGGWFC